MRRNNKSPETAESIRGVEKSLNRVVLGSSAGLAVGVAMVAFSGNVELSPDCAEFMAEAQEEELAALCVSDTIGYEHTFWSTGGVLTSLASTGIGVSTLGWKHKVKKAIKKAN